MLIFYHTVVSELELDWVNRVVLQIRCISLHQLQEDQTLVLMTDSYQIEDSLLFLVASEIKDQVEYKIKLC